jgi:DNA repair protein RadA/Sms
MKPKASRTVYFCSECGAEAARWLGRCPSCGGWNTLAEERVGPKTKGRAEPAREPKPLCAIATDETTRMLSGISELDRVLGGGTVPGGVTLVGGDPGIGKSTLLMQALAAFRARGERVVYVTGEESASQVALRGERIGGEGMDAIDVLATTDLADVEGALTRGKFGVAVVDSIQTIRDPNLESASGTVSQLREVTTRLIEIAKDRSISLFLIGHVTKDGAIAGPKVLEHLVDTVLAFEGDPTGAFRLLRSAKNRFGPAHEVGVFEMVRDGLREVSDPSALFLAERPADAAGSVVTATAEGTRPLLVEVQALVAPAAYGSMRRVATGFDPNRLSILLAVLERRAGVHVLDQDVFVSLAGGARVFERATDLAVAVAVVSSLRGRPVSATSCFVGEVGLAGEVRAVPRAGARIGEARKLGYRSVYVPRASADRLTSEERDGVDVHAIQTLEQALSALDR